MNTKMTKAQMKKVIKDDLTPRYEMARDSHINYMVSVLEEIANINSEMERLETNIDGAPYKSYTEEEKAKKHSLYVKIYGEWDSKANGNYGAYMGGIKQVLTKKQSTMIFDKRMNAKQIKEYYTAEFKTLLATLIEDIIKDIEKFNASSIRMGHSEHDLNIILSKEGKEQSYTINTIVAGGYVQCIHNRTLRKLHKGIV